MTTASAALADEATSAIADYRSAVNALNRLQSNAASLEQVLRERDAKCGEKIPEMIRLAARLGISQEAYNSMRVVHITGTKGKGGTAAYVESILRCHGFRTGFYSSPHLVEVRERIRINGRPLSRAAFAEHFWRTHDTLVGNPGPDPMPAYFPFLTLMAVGVFLAEKVDVAVVEVGIGGRYDSTNFVSSPWVCAVTSLGLDHTALLGHTVALIANQKAGIFKSGCVALTVDSQPAEGMAELAREAALIGCPLLTSPPISAYPNAPDWLANNLAPSQLCNASLAVAVCRIWLRRFSQCQAGGNCGVDDGGAIEGDMAHELLSDKFLLGLQSAKWPGRNTVLPMSTLPPPPGTSSAPSSSSRLFIDGAHTVESVSQAADWFAKATNSACRPRVLMFNRTGDRKPADLLKPLIGLNFSAALFCPNAVDRAGSTADQTSMYPDLANMGVSPEIAAVRVAENMLAFQEIQQLHSSSSSSSTTSYCECRSFESVPDALAWLAELDRRWPGGCDVLVTGSLHLIGCLMARLAPEIATEGFD